MLAAFLATSALSREIDYPVMLKPAHPTAWMRHGLDAELARARAKKRGHQVEHDAQGGARRRRRLGGGQQGPVVGHALVARHPQEDGAGGGEGARLDRPREGRAAGLRRRGSNAS